VTTAEPTHELHIGGMDCANCALTLERSLSQLDGVEEAQVNFSTALLTVRGEVDLVAITGRVEALGYKVIDDSEIEQAHPTRPGPSGGVPGFLRYLLADRTTAVALIGAALLLLSLPLTFLVQTPPVIWALRGLHVAVAALAGFPIARKGIRALLVARQITIDLLMSIAALGALLIGETGEAATVILLFAAGEALEGYTAERSRDAVRSLLTLRPERATVLRPCEDCEEHLGQEGYEGGPCPFCGRHEVTVPVEEVAIGETVLVRPGERIPVDGRVVAGASSVDQAAVTGESIPVPKTSGDEVFAGTINGEGALEIAVTRLAEESTISRIVKLVEQAQSQCAPVERFIDRFARWYTPAIVLVALAVATIPPLAFGAPFLNTPDGTRGWLYRALGLLLVGCPCALVISTPVTVVSALAGLARRGVLVKGGAFLDTLARVETFAFDKTGTLTQGHPVVVDVVTTTCHHNGSRCEACDEMLALAAAVERRSEHPLARAILAEAQARGLDHRCTPAETVTALAGRGVQGRVDGATVTVGSHTLSHENHGMEEALHDRICAAEEAGQTPVVIMRDDALLGFVSVADVPRTASHAALHALKEIGAGVRTVMLTGDHPAVAEAIAGQIGHVDDIQADLLPEDKVSAIAALKAQHGGVAMVGDGINDAPALATATVGIAMGGAGSAQAMAAADVVLMQDDLAHLPDAVRTSRRARRVIRQNILFSLAVKALFLMLMLPGQATLWMAVAADMGASLLVTLNGMRLLRGRGQQDK
jgi:Cd2+/Zn2+-exporting ATPase